MEISKSTKPCVSASDKKNSLDADRKDLNDTGGVMLRCFIKAAQLQCVAKHPTTVKLHPGLLQLRPRTERRSQNWHSQKNLRLKNPTPHSQSHSLSSL